MFMRYRGGAIGHQRGKAGQRQPPPVVLEPQSISELDSDADELTMPGSFAWTVVWDSDSENEDSERESEDSEGAGNEDAEHWEGEDDGVLGPEDGEVAMGEDEAELAAMGFAPM